MQLILTVFSVHKLKKKKKKPHASHKLVFEMNVQIRNKYFNQHEILNEIIKTIFLFIK